MSRVGPSGRGAILVTKQATQASSLRFLAKSPEQAVGFRRQGAFKPGPIDCTDCAAQQVGLQNGLNLTVACVYMGYCQTWGGGLLFTNCVFLRWGTGEGFELATAQTS